MRLSVALMLLAASGIANAAGHAGAPEPATLYADATVIDGTGSAPKPRQDILVRGERIVAIGAHGTLAGTDSGTRIVDLLSGEQLPRIC